MSIRSSFLTALRAAGLSVVFSGVMGAQQGSVTGKITEETTGQPLADVRVQVSNSSVAAISTQDGAYTLRLSPGTYQLRTVRVGYSSTPQSVTVRAGEATTLDWRLRSVPYALEGVVVTATGEQLRRELGNDVGRIDASTVAQTAPVTNISQVLSGRVAGVNVLQSSGMTGQGSRIRVRGLSSVSLSNEPVVYIDGIRVASETPLAAANANFIGGALLSHLNDINPEDIESIEIVKGPSAATLYGTQAANGVVRITTKRGAVGAQRWNVWLERGMMKDFNDYPDTWFSKRVGSTTAPCLPYQQALGQCQIEQLYRLSLMDDKATTPFGTGERSQLGASVSGGSELLRYFVSGESERELGVMKMPAREVDYLRAERGADVPFEQRRPNEQKKNSGRLNVSASPTSQLTLNLASAVIRNDIRLPQLGDNFQSMITSPLTGSANPAVFAATGGYGFSRPADGMGEVTYRRNTHYITSGNASWQPLSWLTARSTVGLDYLAYNDEQNVLNGQGCKTCGTERQGKRQMNRWTQSKYSVDANATANLKATDRIASRTSIGAQYNFDRLFGVLAQADILPPGSLTLTAGAQKTLTEQTAEVKTIGQFIEQQFSLDDRLFLVGAVRVDANSAFGRDSRSATYPKVSGSYVAFENRTGWLSDLRLRAAYGLSGLQPTALAALTYDNPVTASIFGAPNTPGAILGATGDPELKPERSAEIEGGGDIAFFDSRIRLGLTYYDKVTKDALVNRNIPPSLGTTANRIENIGTVTNTGIEVSLGARVIDRPSLGWDVHVEAAGNRNRLKSLGTGVPPLVGFGFKNIPGYPLFGLWWPGLKSWSDANSDGFIDPTEVVVTDTLVFHGSTVPTRTLNLTNTFSLLQQRLSLGFMTEYKGGFVTHNVNDLFQCAFQVNCRSIHDPTASQEDQAKAVAGARAFGAYADDATFVRLREVSATYNVGARVARYARASGAQVVLTGRNLYLWKRTNTWDPENVTQSADSPNYNFGALAQPAMFVFRLNLEY